METKCVRAIDNKNLVQAVVVADSYDHNFSPLCDSSPLCLMPLVNRPMLDYTLECLSAAGVQEAILFCSSYADKIKEFVRLGEWGRMSVNVVVSEGCRSLGDAMRDLDAKAVIRTDFILLSGTVVGSLNLLPLLERHKKVQNKDKGAAMTVLYKECGNKNRHQKDELYLAIDRNTDRILYHSKKPTTCNIGIPAATAIDIPLEVVLERNCLDVRCDLVDTGVSICSVSVPPLFSDNFDFQTREDFVRGLLMNEEILESTLYAQVLPPQLYASEVTHWLSYHSISRDIIHRWTYPQVPGGFIDDTYSYRFGNIYLENLVSMETGSKLEEDVVIGRNSCIGANTRISSSVIGTSCRILQDVVIKNSHIFSNVTIEAGSVIEYCVIGAGCLVKAGARLKSSILGPEVVVPAEKNIHKMRLQSSSQDKDDEGVGEHAYEYRCDDEGEDTGSQDSSTDEVMPSREAEWIGLEPVLTTDYLQYDDVHSDDEQDTASLTTSQPDDTNLFFSEVVDSLTRGLEDSLPCDNLVLEVNSSRYAYNVSLREVNYHVSRAVLSLNSTEGPCLKWETIRSTINYFLPLLSNYIKNREAMSDCLSAIEDVSECKEEVRVLTVKLLSYLYEKDLLTEESILEWHANPRDSSSYSTLLRKQVMPFIKWLEEADEQSDSDD